MVKLSFQVLLSFQPISNLNSCIKALIFVDISEFCIYQSIHTDNKLQCRQTFRETTCPSLYNDPSVLCVVVFCYTNNARWFYGTPVSTVFAAIWLALTQASWKDLQTARFYSAIGFSFFPRLSMSSIYLFGGLPTLRFLARESSPQPLKIFLPSKGIKPLKYKQGKPIENPSIIHQKYPGQ